MTTQKDNAMDAMQDFFPNGGREWDAIGALYDAIAAGKIPGVVTGEKVAELEERLQQPIKLPPLMPEDIFAMTPQRHMVANAHNNAIAACSMSIRGAGFKSECTVWKESKEE